MILLLDTALESRYNKKDKCVRNWSSLLKTLQKNETNNNFESMLMKRKGMHDEKELPRITEFLRGSFQSDKPGLFMCLNF